MYGQSLKLMTCLTLLLVFGGWLCQGWAWQGHMAWHTHKTYTGDRSATVAATFATPSLTKLISWGWSAPIAEYVKHNLASMEGRPFDGVVPTTIFTRGYYFGSLTLTNTPFNRVDVQSDIDNLKTASSSKVLTQNFYHLSVAASSEPPDWFEDWTIPLSNMRLMARIVKESGLKGFLIDTETYNSTFFDYETRK